MPVLAFNKPVRSAASQLVVENAFEPGSYRFRLVVVDNSGNESAPNELVVQVMQRPVSDRDTARDRIADRLRDRLSPTRPGG